jgi:ubiquinone/menaquinone biosynthesis C-methylase UbiE
MGLYSRHIFPRILEWSLSGRPVTDLRIKALEPARGQVLEIGFGTGLNIPCYPSAVGELVAVDSELMMAGRVRDRIVKSPFPVNQKRLDASEKLPLEDRWFDTVVTTFTLCSIANVGAALKEIRRVLKPDGIYLFLEHGRSDDSRIARFQDYLNPIQNIIGAGCNLNRKIDHLIREAGFDMIQLNRFAMAQTPRLVGEMYSGIARWRSEGP